MPSPKKQRGTYKWLYLLLNAIFGVLFFVVPFKLFVEGKFQGLELFGYTLITMFLGTLIGSWVARAISNYYDIQANVKFVTKNILIILFYSGFIAVGVIEFIFATYPIFELIGMDVLKALFIIKLIINVVADDLASAIATGGK